MNKKNFIVRFFLAFWAGADGVRKVLHLVLLLFIFLMFFGALSGTPPLLPKNAALYIQPYGSLVEQLDGSPYDRAIQELLDDGRAQTLVQDIVDALQYARDDDHIQVVHLELSSVLGAGLSKLQRVGLAIDDFKTSGKTVIASADFMSQPAYFLAARADKVFLHPDGAVMLSGYGSFKTYYKDAIDKLLLDWNVFRVGTHKSFVEPFTRMDMSDEDRESTTRLIEHLWTLYLAGVTQARGLEEGVIDDFVQNLVEHVRATGGDMAIAAKNHGLVDELLTRNELRERMIEYVGEDEDNPGMVNAVDMAQYLRQLRMMSGSGAEEKNVAIVVAAGNIFFGERAPGGIGADSTVALLRRARHDDSVHAVVLRVDSPGGSAFAADIIADEIDALREAGKPVVASMSSVAASGGYSISMNADKIFASAATITGSIGVFGMFPTYQRTMTALGIATDGVGSTPWSGQLRPDREMSQQTRELFQLAIEDTYDDFISDVAERRGLEKSAVDRIGQGQVWTGTDALANGLVDELGTLEDAVAAAAAIAELGDVDYGVITIEPEVSATEQLVVNLLGIASRAHLDISGWLPRPNSLQRIARSVAERADAVLEFNDPHGVYAHCLCDNEL